MPYHGENHVRADQQPVTWLNCKGHNTMHKQNRIEQRFHAEFPYTGPTTNDLRPKLQVDVVWNLWKQIEVQRKTQVMLYTREGEGCRLLERDSRGRTSSIRPGRDYRPLRTATNAIEAAVANKFYPHQEYKIMAAAMRCGPNFPVPMPKPSEHKADGSKKRGAATILDVLAAPEIVQNILSHLCFTDRASLSQTCTGATMAISNWHTVWYVNSQEFDDAEFLDEEFKYIVEAGEMWAVNSLRGAKVLMVTMAAGAYNPNTGYRAHWPYMQIAAGTLRFLRAMDNRGRYVEQLTLKNVPFMDHKVLAGIVEFCPNLRKLEIVGCEQFTIFSVAPFLKFLQDVQKKRGVQIYFDAAPAFYKGPRWLDVNELMCKTHDRKGTFGVAASDPGCDIPTAMCKLLLYNIIPAIQAADQFHMIYNYSCLFRQWLEALPGPRLWVPLALACWDVDERIRELDAAAEKVWRAQLTEDDFADPEDPPVFTWDIPQLRFMERESIERDTLRQWTLVRAMCGDNGWKQTADRGFYSCNYQCTAGNFMEHFTPMKCRKCHLSLARLFFNAISVCEGCRLEERVVYGEKDHLQQWKRQATEALGYGAVDESFRTNAESNFPFDAFKRRDENGDLPVKSRADFVRILDSTLSLRKFIDTAMEMEYGERLAGYCKGRKTIRQLDHPLANYPSVGEDQRKIVARHPYRRALTHGEYAESDGKGWEPANKASFLQW